MLAYVRDGLDVLHVEAFVHPPASWAVVRSFEGAVAQCLCAQEIGDFLSAIARHLTVQVVRAS